MTLKFWVSCYMNVVKYYRCLAGSEMTVFSASVVNAMIFYAPNYIIRDTKTHC